MKITYEVNGVKMTTVPTTEVETQIRNCIDTIRNTEGLTEEQATRELIDLMNGNFEESLLMKRLMRR